MYNLSVYQICLFIHIKNLDWPVIIIYENFYDYANTIQKMCLFLLIVFYDDSLFNFNSDVNVMSLIVVNFWLVEYLFFILEII